MIAERATLETLLTELASAPTEPAEARDARAWCAWQATLDPSDPQALALRAGVRAPSVGFAFASGYQAALRALCPTFVGDALAALCVTEAAGARPSDMTTMLVRDTRGSLSLSGKKTYVTLGPLAELLLVAATDGHDERGRVRLALVRVPASAAGVALSERPPLPFVPEIPHAEVTFTATPIAADDLLPGDGFSDYVKPFRTVEDLHVYLALTAYLTRIARRYGWPQELFEDLLAAAATGVALARGDRSDPALHLALASHLRAIRALVQRAEPAWALADEPERKRWQRDRALFTIAETARAARTAAAWRALAPASASHRG